MVRELPKEISEKSEIVQFPNCKFFYRKFRNSWENSQMKRKYSGRNIRKLIWVYLALFRKFRRLFIRPCKFAFDHILTPEQLP